MKDAHSLGVPASFPSARHDNDLSRRTPQSRGSLLWRPRTGHFQSKGTRDNDMIDQGQQLMKARPVIALQIADDLDARLPCNSCSACHSLDAVMIDEQYLRRGDRVVGRKIQ